MFSEKIAEADPHTCTFKHEAFSDGVPIQTNPQHEARLDIVAEKFGYRQGVYSDEVVPMVL